MNLSDLPVVTKRPTVPTAEEILGLYFPVLDHGFVSLVDYMGGENSVGGMSVGVAWKFTPHISMIVGYDFWNEHAVAGANTITTQLDIDF